MGTGQSFVIDNFVGLFRKVIQCSNCGSTATLFEPFCVIDIPVVGTDRRIGNVKITTLMVCVTQFLTQRAAAIRECQACQDFTERVKSWDFWALPPVLAFHLKYEEKGLVFVEFPDDFDFSHLVHRERTARENTRYRLFAVVNRDEANWGVNVIVQNPMLDGPAVDGKWFAFGPNFAMVSPNRSWHSSQASVLLYERW
jgi:ubiquitin C-terminal hydrolase